MPPAVVTMPDGIRIFVVDSHGTLHTGLYGGGSITPGTWTTIGSGFTATPAVVKYPGERLRVFARKADGTVATTQRAADGSFPGPWTSLGDTVIVGSPGAVLDPETGRTEVLALVAGDEIRRTVETAQGSGVWRPTWDTILLGAATEPTVVPLTNQDTAWAVVSRTVDNRPLITTATYG